MTFRLVLATLCLTTTALASTPGTHVGIVTDTMCGANHAQMKMGPDHACVRECVGDGRTYKYALLKGGKVYPLSDQETPAKFAGQRVKVTGQIYPRTGILRVDRIAAMK